MPVDRLRCFSTYILLLCIFWPATGGNSTLDDDELVIRRWEDTLSRIKRMVGQAIKVVLPHVMSSVSGDDLQISQQCRRALFVWLADLKSMKPWALKMGDASAKVIDGLFSGTLSSFGSFDQCLDIASPKGDITGSYCSVEGRPRLPKKPRFYALNQRLPIFKRFENDTGMMGEFTKHVQLFYMFPLRLGICVPSPCSSLDIQNLTSLASKHLFSVNITVPRCQTKEPVVLESYQIPIFVVIAVLVFLVLCGTVYDLFVYQKRNPDSAKDIGVATECLLAFSAPKNWSQLVDLEAGAEDLSVLHGIRFISMCWVILGHTYFHLNFNILKHLQITIELATQFIFNSVTNATLVVDNFFFLSGLLLVYVTMDMVKVIGKIPRIPYFIIHRFWRFLPIQMFFVGLSTMLPLMGSGPTWHENIDPIVEGCRKDWWVNMIFINNIYRTTEKGCLSYSWYLAADFQIYIFCIPIVILIIKKPRIGLLVNFVVMVMSVIAVGVHNYVRDLPPTMLFTHADVEQRTALMTETYYTPYQHVGPCCIGLFVGYFLKVKKAENIKIHWYLQCAAWVTCFTLTSSALFGVHPWNRGLDDPGRLASVLYASLSRIAWTLGIAWITVACTIGYGGILAKVLRSKVCIPFSRLTFLVYMVHPLVQHVFYATLRGGIQAMNHLAIFICFGFIASSYGIALVLSLLLESPFINLGKILFRRRESAKRQRRELAKSVLPFQDWKAPPFITMAGKCNSAFDSKPEIVVNGHTEDCEKEDYVCRL